LQSGSRMDIVSYALLVFSIVFLICGILGSVSSIEIDWAHHGGPFACRWLDIFLRSKQFSSSDVCLRISGWYGWKSTKATRHLVGIFLPSKLKKLFDILLIMQQKGLLQSTAAIRKVFCRKYLERGRER